MVSRFADGKFFLIFLSLIIHNTFKLTFVNVVRDMIIFICFIWLLSNETLADKWRLIYLCWSVRNWGQCPGDTQHQSAHTNCPQQDQLPSLRRRLWSGARSDIHASSGALFLQLRSTWSSPQNSWWFPEIYSICVSFGYLNLEIY